MSAIPLFGEANRNFIGNEFFNALICKLLEQEGVSIEV
jgi:hypothetical protein